MKDNPKKDLREKKPYEKPEVKQIPLRPEEAVLGFCKVSSSSAGPLTSNCTLCSLTGS
jgi:hypothetical protein